MTRLFTRWLHSGLLHAGLLSGAGILLTACSPTSILNHTSGAEALRVAEDLAYGEDPRQRLDIYRGETASCRIVYVYGGSWQEGDKSSYGFVGAQLARQGYEVVIPNYRLYPQVRYPAFVEDVALSLSYLQREYPSDKPLVLMGHSAGAMIASLISYDRKYLRDQGLAPDLIAANIALAGPHDYFLPSQKPEWVGIFGENPESQVEALAVNHVSSQSPPSLILHGLEDEIVTPESARSITAALEAHGVPVTLQLYEDVGHRRLVAALGYPLHFLAPTLADIKAFLASRGCSAGS